LRFRWYPHFDFPLHALLCGAVPIFAPAPLQRRVGKGKRLIPIRLTITHEPSTAFFGDRIMLRYVFRIAY
jgi:hypothetical protein